MTRRYLSISLLLAVSQLAAPVFSRAQQPAVPAQQPAASTTPQASGTPLAGGTIHGTVKSGTIPLPGVSITATNTLTGKKYSTASDSRGNFSMTIPQNGRYVLRTELAAFAPTTQEALLNATSRDQKVDLTLTLASRAAQQEEQQTAATRQYTGRGSQSLSLADAATGLIAAAGGDSAASTAALPSLASNPDVSSESVAVAGQNGSTNPFAGINFGDGPPPPGAGDASYGGPGGGGPGGGGPGAFGGGGGFGGPGGGGFGGGGGRGGRGNFRNFNPNQPHGAIFWNGGNSALNAQPFALRGQPLNQPSYASNRFGLTFIGAPYIPHLLTHDTKDFLFFTLSGQRSSSPFDQYGTVPLAAERMGNFQDLTTPEGAPIPIYDPGCYPGDPNKGKPFPQNTIPAQCISPQATALLNYIPAANLPGAFQNYRRLSTAQTNTTTIGARLIHNFGAGGNTAALGNMIRQRLGQGNSPGLHQNINLNFNYSHTASDSLNLFPDLGGNHQTTQYSVQAGYSVSKGHLANIFNLNWNRTNSQARNYFTDTTDVAGEIGLNGLPTNPLLYGLPDVTLNQFSSLSEQQPAYQLNQTISVSDSLSWIHKKNNIRVGVDYRRVHLDMIGQTNSTGTYIFTGLYTQEPSSSSTPSGSTTTGSSLADMLLGLPQQTSLQAPYAKAYLRENVIDAYVQDDWRALPNLTINAGLRYEYFSPYSEKSNRLATLDTGYDYTQVATVTPNTYGPYTGFFPGTLIYPEKNNFSPRIGIAWRAIKDTVVRAGYGINFANGQYVKFVQDFAFQPPFADVQTNEATTGANITLANGFPGPQPEGNYSVNKNYRLPYVQVWNLDVQRTLPLGIVLNVGYNGSKGTRLDIVDAPGRFGTFVPAVLYDYENSVAFSNFNALTVRARKRMQNGIALGATYTYSHSIDNATSIGGNGGSSAAIAQNWQDLLAEESNSSFDIRQQLKGDFVYELPFGPDGHYLNTGNFLSHTIAGLSVSGNFTFATGSPLTPHYEAAVADVARGSTGSLRPDRVPGVSLTAGGGTLDNWFNKAAFENPPAGGYGSASRFSIPGPGTVAVNMSFSRTQRFAEMKTLEVRATVDNVFNTVQYSGVDTTLGSATYGEVISTAAMRQFNFLARFRF